MLGITTQLVSGLIMGIYLHLRYYRNDFSQNIELPGGDLSDYSWDMGHNSGCSCISIERLLISASFN
jgi:uncharacterized protein YneF (UPF0154 family)